MTGGASSPDLSEGCGLGVRFGGAFRGAVGGAGDGAGAFYPR